MLSGRRAGAASGGVLLLPRREIARAHDGARRASGPALADAGAPVQGLGEVAVVLGRAVRPAADPGAPVPPKNPPGWLRAELVAASAGLIAVTSPRGTRLEATTTMSGRSSASRATASATRGGRLPDPDPSRISPRAPASTRRS